MHLENKPISIYIRVYLCTVIYLLLYVYNDIYIYVYTRVYIHCVCVQFTYICTVLFLYVTGVVWYGMNGK